ncbi:MAG TPA: lipoyl(octanoyl) transferase LipB [Bacteroidales bacterium]|nr:lipoyl(octanoyl) transferase LipB [Bacteroidales bacterium]
MSYKVKYEDIGLRDYKEVWDYQTSIFNRLIEEKKDKGKRKRLLNKSVPGTLIFVEHPHVYTLGKSGLENNLLINQIQLRAKNVAFYRTDRGGDITYHGPGQIVVYPVFDLEEVGISLKEYIYRLEEAVIMTMSVFGLKGERLAGATGVWLNADNSTKALKICAIGVKASRYITMHGFAFNINTELEYFNYINPCGFTDKGVTSLQKETGIRQDMTETKKYLLNNLKYIFDLQFINSISDGEKMGSERERRSGCRAGAGKST